MILTCTWLWVHYTDHEVIICHWSRDYYSEVSAEKKRVDKEKVKREILEFLKDKPISFYTERFCAKNPIYQFVESKVSVPVSSQKAVPQNYFQTYC